MNLAEALLERAGLAAEITTISESLQKNIWGGQDSAPWFLSQLTKLEAKRAQLQKLTTDVNYTNTMAGITELISQRDSLKGDLRLWENLSSQLEYERDGKSAKIAMISKTDVQDKIVQIQKSAHSVNLQLQRLNWETELQSRP